MNHLSLLAILLLTVTAVQCATNADWMRGKWGIGLRISSSIYYSTDGRAFDPTVFVDQLNTIHGDPSWVIINLSGPALDGDYFLSYNPTLWDLGNTGSCPGPEEDDAFEAILDTVGGAGYKVIAYMATQGPALLKHGIDTAHDYDAACDCSPAYDRWEANCTATYQALGEGDCDRETATGVANLKKHYAEKIVRYYSNLYGDKIAGWWFDHSDMGDMELIAEAVREGNAYTSIAFNSGTKVPLQVNTPGLEDYTFGHPTPVRKAIPSDDINEPMVTSIEASNNGYLEDAGGFQAVGHIFMPMGERWNTIDTPLAWPEDRAADWMSRVLNANGAWTWNLPRESNGGKDLSKLDLNMVDFLNDVVDQVFAESSSSPSVTPSEEPSIIPSDIPSSVPSLSPTLYASSAPSVEPSLVPSATPSIEPSDTPSDEPSDIPSAIPSTAAPSIVPSDFPTAVPSAVPSDVPSRSPVVLASDIPSSTPSISPVVIASDMPSRSPVVLASAIPSSTPSRSPVAIVASSCNYNRICEEGEDCNSCPNDCRGRTNVNYCCTGGSIDGCFPGGGKCSAGLKVCDPFPLPGQSPVVLASDIPSYTPSRSPVAIVASSCNYNRICEEGEDCNSCPNDCRGRTNSNYCCTGGSIDGCFPGGGKCSAGLKVCDPFPLE